MIKAFLVILLCVAMFYCIGTLFIWLSKQKPLQERFADVFVRTLLGFVFTSALYSIVQTHGNTISWGFFAVWAMFVSYRKAEGTQTGRIPLSQEYFSVTQKDVSCWATMVVVALLFVVANGVFFYGTPFNFEPHFDYNYYAAVADEMTARGVESNNVMRDVLWQKDIAPTPYHYIELWATSMISLFFHINSTETIFIVIYAIMGTLFVLGLFAIARQFESNAIFLLIALFSMFFAPIAYFDYTIGFNVLKVLNLECIFTSLINTKTLIVALFFTFSLLLYKYDKNYFLISLLVLPIVNIVLSPSVFVAVGCLFFYQTIRKSKSALIVLLETVMLGIMILCFYVLQSKGESLGNFSTQNVEENILEISSIIKSAIKLVVFIMVYHLPMLVAIGYCWKKDKIATKEMMNRNAVLIVTTSILLMSGFVVAQITKGVRDNTQFYALPTEILPVVYAMFAFEFLTICTKKWERVIITSFCLLFFAYSLKYNTFQVKNPNPFSTDPNFLADVESVVAKTNTRLVATFDASYTYPYPISSQTDIYLRTIYIGERDLYSPIPSSFTSFCDEYEAKNGKTSLDTLQYEFLIENDIKQIVPSKSAELPVIVKNLIDTTYISADKREFSVLKRLEK